jgi:hypothetical protein
MAQNKPPSGAEINQPFIVAVIAPIRPGASENWRRYLQELTDSRRADYEASRRRWGITGERAWLIETATGVVAIMAVTTTQPEHVVERLVAGDLPLERRFREQLLAAQGVDLTHLSTQPLVELVFDWFGLTEADLEGGEDEM